MKKYVILAFVIMHVGFVFAQRKIIGINNSMWYHASSSSLRTVIHDSLGEANVVVLNQSKAQSISLLNPAVRFGAEGKSSYDIGISNLKWDRSYVSDKPFSMANGSPNFTMQKQTYLGLFIMRQSKFVSSKLPMFMAQLNINYYTNKVLPSQSSVFPQKQLNLSSELMLGANWQFIIKEKYSFTAGAFVVAGQYRFLHSRNYNPSQASGAIVSNKLDIGNLMPRLRLSVGLFTAK